MTIERKMAMFNCISIALISAFFILCNSEPTQEEKQALQDLYTSLPHSTRLNWNPSDSVCNWVGVQCDSNRSYIYALHLPGVGLMGTIPENTIGRLASLRVISLRSNLLTGQIPKDFSNLAMLRSLYLQNNQLSGEFESVLPQLTRLTRLDLSFNNFTGKIPDGVGKLTHLTGLFLQHNGFTGELPSVSLDNLADFNVSDNELNGTIPKGFVKFPGNSFAGNLGLCGGPLPPCSPNFPSPAPAPGGGGGDGLVAPSSTAVRLRRKLSTAAIVGIVVGCVLAVLVLLGLVFLSLIKRRREQPASGSKPVGTGEVEQHGVDVAAATASSSKDGTTGGEGGERNKLVFLDSGGVYSFDLEDLLRASAEVLGKGSVWTSYKAVLEEGTTVVVKRLKDVVVSKSDFEAHMEGVLGRIRHENVVPLRAYYFSKDEKLLVFDYLSAGSLSALLHGNRGSGRTPLHWDNRMRIALGTARGLNYIHSSGNVPHGNIKSSNILLRTDYDPCLSDYGLNPLFSNNIPSNRAAGYRAPEVMETRKVTYKSDVYSFGVLLLELLTGKAPNSQASLGDEGIDLPRWVQSVVREEWTAEVFDVELMSYHNIEEEMVQLLQIAMACASTVPDQRPDMNDVVRMIEEINKGETDSGTIRQSSDDPSKGSDAHTPPIERTPPSSVTP